MAKFQMPPAIAVSLPKAPKEYDQAYMNRLVASLEDQLRYLNGPHQMLAAGIVTYEMPTVTDIATLKPGTVYIDGDTLKVVP